MPEPNPAPTPARPQEAGGAGGGGGGGGGGYDFTPRPDPTELTSRAVDALRIEMGELFDSKIEGIKGVIEERLAGIDRATELRLQDLPTTVDEKVDHLKELVFEKFESVGQQFRERDTRSERESRDNKVAVDAAFAAQKEAASEQNKSNTLAIDKSEKATAETLNKQADLFKSTTDALAAQVNDIKLRVNGIESVKVGGQETKAATYAVIGLGVTVLLAVLTVLGFIAANGSP